jgi:hypothetical protein
MTARPARWPPPLERPPAERVPAARVPARMSSSSTRCPNRQLPRVTSVGDASRPSEHRERWSRAPRACIRSGYRSGGALRLGANRQSVAAEQVASERRTFRAALTCTGGSVRHEFRCIQSPAETCCGGRKWVNAGQQNPAHDGFRSPGRPPPQATVRARRCAPIGCHMPRSPLAEPNCDDQRREAGFEPTVPVDPELRFQARAFRAEILGAERNEALGRNA